MSNLTKMKKNDNYATPKQAWLDLKPYVPTDKIIYMPFYYNGKAKEYLEELEVKEVIHEEVDYFENRFEYDCIIDNPPFSMKKQVLTKLKEDGAPFMLLMPTSVACTQYFRKLFKDERIQLIIPKSRIHFESDTEDLKNGCCFDCFWYCWKMDLPMDVNFIQ